MLAPLLAPCVWIATSPALTAGANDQAGARALAIGLFSALVMALLALDLGVFHRKSRIVEVRESIVWTCAWVSLALLLGLAVYPLYEHRVLGLGLGVPVLGSPGEFRDVPPAEAVKAYLAAYVLEQSLSLDNVFVIGVVFASLGIPGALQHRVLFWGILGAMVMRGAMIFAGAALVARFSWIGYVFGGILILTAIKMAMVRHDATDPAASRTLRLLRRTFPITDRLEGQRFLVRRDGRLWATPLLVALVLIEVTDLIFAVDSVPAVFALTADPFIVFTSNVMAILGLRSLYFFLAAMVRRLRYLRPALVGVLLFAGVKMCLVHTPLKIPIDASLATVLGLLGAGALASLVADRRAARAGAERPGKVGP